MHRVSPCRIRILRPYSSSTFSSGSSCIAGAGEALAEQKIAVAVDEVAGHAGLLQRFQRRGDLRVQRLGIVVADPGFKQVAEDVQRVGVNRFAL